METAVEIEKIIDGIRARMKDAMDLATNAAAVRREKALAADQGDAGARKALAKAEKDERSAAAVLKNLELARAEAEARAEAARKREAGDHQQDLRRRYDRAIDNLLASDAAAVSVMRTLRQAFDARRACISAIFGLADQGKFLSSANANVFDRGQHLTDALAELFFRELGTLAPNYSTQGAVTAFIETECVLLGRKPPARELTPIERTIARSAKSKRDPYHIGAVPSPARAAGGW